MRLPTLRESCLCVCLVAAGHLLFAQNSVSAAVSAASGSQAVSAGVSGESMSASVSSAVSGSIIGSGGRRGASGSRSASSFYGSGYGPTTRGGTGVSAGRVETGRTSGGVSQALSKLTMRGHRAELLAKAESQLKSHASLAIGSSQLRSGMLGNRSESFTSQQFGASTKGPAGAGNNAAYVGGIFGGGFPDSTKGTALLSPPDTGTSSSLEWQPGLKFGLPGFTGPFLRPTYLVAGAHAGGRMRSRGGKRLGKSTPSSLPSLGLTQPNSFLTNGLSQPTFESPLDELTGTQ